MWSDPSEEVAGFKISQRGAGYIFGEDASEMFLHSNNLSMVFRAHQMCMEGYTPCHGGKVVTVWSAPNYLYRFKNKACIVELDDFGNQNFNLFDAAPESARLRRMSHKKVGKMNSSGTPGGRMGSTGTPMGRQEIEAPTPLTKSLLEGTGRLPKLGGPMEGFNPGSSGGFNDKRQQSSGFGSPDFGARLRSGLGSSPPSNLGNKSKLDGISTLLKGRSAATLQVPKPAYTDFRSSITTCFDHDMEEILEKSYVDPQVEEIPAISTLVKARNGGRNKTATCDNATRKRGGQYFM
eukprot:GHVU01055216.1.p1 GENE.GHVU01055216.1~~GHVU01055216.1.p1  ORF type:complete len:293 (+),score=36.74 GHVU01055216.1:371-1249(+)